MAYRKKTEADLRRELAQLQDRYNELRDQVRTAVDAVEQGEHPKLVMRRLAAKVKLRGGARSWTDDDIITKAWEWFHRYGSTPTANDWSPALAKANAREVDPERLQRWLDGEWPSTATVQRRFGGWNAMVARAELPLNELDRTLPKRTTGDLDHLPAWIGWQLLGPYRQRAGIASHAELSRRSGVSVDSIRRMERGELPNPTLRIFLGVAQGLGVPPAALLELENRTTTTDED